MPSARPHGLVARDAHFAGPNAYDIVGMLLQRRRGSALIARSACKFAQGRDRMPARAPQRRADVGGVVLGYAEKLPRSTA